MSERQKELEEITDHLHQALDRYQGTAQVRGDFMEAVFCVHHALRRVFELELKASDPEFVEQSPESSFYEMARRVIPNSIESHRVEELAIERNHYAHPEHNFYNKTESQDIRRTAVGLVDLALEVWPELFVGSPPTIGEHPPLSTPEPFVPSLPQTSERQVSVPRHIVAPADVSALREDLKRKTQKIENQERALKEKDVKMWHLQERLADKRDHRRMLWRALIIGVLLLLPIPGLVGFGECLWRNRSSTWHWLLIPAGLTLASIYCSARSLYRFFRSVGLVRVIAILSVVLVIATLALTPFASARRRWDEKAGAALTKVLAFLGRTTSGYVSSSFDIGNDVASYLFSLPVPPGTTDRATATPRASQTGEITLGVRVTVRKDGQRLLSRVAPGLSSTIQARFENGAQLVVIDGPVEQDGFVWWEVEGEAGQGWSVADYLEP